MVNSIVPFSVFSPILHLKNRNAGAAFLGNKVGLDVDRLAAKRAGGGDLGLRVLRVGGCVGRQLEIAQGAAGKRRAAGGDFGLDAEIVERAGGIDLEVGAALRISQHLAEIEQRAGQRGRQGLRLERDRTGGLDRAGGDVEIRDVDGAFGASRKPCRRRSPAYRISRRRKRAGRQGGRKA